MGALELGKALGGVAEGYMRGIKIKEEQAAKRLDQLMTEQTLAKNEMLLKKSREEDMKDKAASEIDAELWKAKTTGNLAEFKDSFGKIHSPFTVGTMVNKDGTVDIVSSIDGSKLKTVTFGEFSNAVYRSVAGKDHELYTEEVKARSMEIKDTQEAELIKLRQKEERITKQTPPGENPNVTARENKALELKKSSTAAYIESLRKGKEGEPAPQPPSAGSVFGVKK